MAKKTKKNGADVVVEATEPTITDKILAEHKKKQAADMAAVIRKAKKIEKEGDSILSGFYNKAEARKTKRANAVPVDKQIATYDAKIAELNPDYEKSKAIVAEFEAKVKEAKEKAGIKDRAPRKAPLSIERGRVVRKTALRTALGKKGWELTPTTAILGQLVVNFEEDGWEMRDAFKEVVLVPMQEYGKGAMKLINDITATSH